MDLSDLAGFGPAIRSCQGLVLPSSSQAISLDALLKGRSRVGSLV